MRDFSSLDKVRTFYSLHFYFFFKNCLEVIAQISVKCFSFQGIVNDHIFVAITKVLSEESTQGLGSS